MTDRPPRTLSQTEMLRWIDRTRRGSKGGPTDWVTVLTIAKKLAQDPTSDLRSEYERAMEDNRPLYVKWAFALMTIRWFGVPAFEHEIFLEGAPLGSLETLQVYSTNFSSFDVVGPNMFRGLGSKGHAPFHCQHSEGTSRFDELLPYAEFIKRYREWDRWAEQDNHAATYALCSFCGGATLRLLTDEQLSHYIDVEGQAKARQAAESRAGVTRLRPRL